MNRERVTPRSSVHRDLKAVPSEPVPDAPGADVQAPDVRAAAVQANDDTPAPEQPAPVAHSGLDQASIVERLNKMEKQNRWMRLLIVLLLVAVGYGAFLHFAPDAVTVRQTMMESQQLKLVDKSGNTRLFLRMYSRVPVLQLLDSKGKPRLSLGMRFDDTPFIDLSDKTGRTRATLELTESDQPTLRMYDQNGEPTFKLN